MKLVIEILRIEDDNKAEKGDIRTSEVEEILSGDEIQRAWAKILCGERLALRNENRKVIGYMSLEKEKRGDKCQN